MHLSAHAPSVDADLERAATIVAAYVSHNTLRASDLAELITAVHASIRRLGQDPVAVPAAVQDAPAVPIKKSVTKDYVVCLEDGKKFKSLKRHLSSFHNLTPEQYRAKWNLPSDHPMVAPSYSATRSQLAKDSGLGHVEREGSQDAPSPAPGKRPRGRPRKSV
jgi:predicted transcriptional regulator